MNILDFKKNKEAGKKITMVTCYDYWSAKIIEDSEIDCVLVGDSLSMIMHGAPNTVHANIEVMALHIKAVATGLNSKFLVGDMPFLSFRKSLDENMNNVEQLMKAGAHAIKIEGADGNKELIKHLTESGIPVMGHIGLTPQFVHKFGGHKVQGRNDKAAEALLTQAKQLESWGCFSLVIEAIPSFTAEKISNELSIPTIGIGAGPNTDGQVLVLQDMLGMDNNFKPKFLKKYLNGHELVLNALNSYHKEVVNKEFPTIEESYE